MHNAGVSAVQVVGKRWGYGLCERRTRNEIEGIGHPGRLRGRVNLYTNRHPQSGSAESVTELSAS